MNKNRLSDLYHKGYISSIDFHFARFIADLCQSDDQDIFLGAALVSQAAGQGDGYLDLAAVADKPLEHTEEGLLLKCPKLSLWQEKLHKAAAVGRPGDFRPLILDNKNRLYLYRYWDYEKKLADAIIKRAHDDIVIENEAAVAESLTRLFPKTTDRGTNWQKVAAFTAAFKKFCLISGGPGTGKTHAVAQILALLVEYLAGEKPVVLLAAPTGKAAAKLSEALAEAKKKLNCCQEVIDAIPCEAYTIHRLLKTIPGSPYFYHNDVRPLNADVVVIDEGSMVDLALMSKLMAALPDKARLILMGDKDQLASVETGSVLGDICNRNRVPGFSVPFRRQYEKVTREKLDVFSETDIPHPGLTDCIVLLKKSFRFAQSSPVGELSRCVNRGDIEKALALLKNESSRILWQDTRSLSDPAGFFSEKIIDGYSGYLKSVDPQEALERFNRLKILCAVNIGPSGVNTINRLAEQILSRAGLIYPDRQWYHGRPVLIIRNDYQLELYNGDLGITLKDPDSVDPEPYVYFQGGPGEIRRIRPFRLPEHETVYAMTVHKSQGSEFDDILLVLPDKDYPVLTRELLYTAITRARRNIWIWGAEDVVRTAVSRQIQRTSGLREALWESDLKE